MNIFDRYGDVTPIEAAALLVIDGLEPVEMVELADRWLCDGRDLGSPEAAHLAAQSAPVSDDAKPGFARLLVALGAPAPKVDEAVLLALALHLRAITERRVPPFDGMALIDRRFRTVADSPGPRLQQSPDTGAEDATRYLGSRLGLEHLYTWYRELQDAADGSMLLYFNELPRERQVERFTEELYDAAVKLHDALVPRSSPGTPPT